MPVRKGNKCEHGVYWPESHEIAFSCQTCNPTIYDERPNQPIPRFNRRGALKLNATGDLPICPTCQIPIPISDPTCFECGTEFEIETTENVRANNKQPGICPECSSGIHFEIEVQGKTKWQCADCDTVYSPPKRVRK